MKHIKFDIEENGIAVLTLDNADESMNLVSPEFITEFTEAVQRVADEEAITGAIVTSGKKAFMAGADLKFIGSAYDRGMSAHDVVAFCKKPSDMHRLMETCGKPFVCVMNGLALGGGFELALACHYRILVDDPKAVVGLPEVNLGLLPGSGGTQRLPRIVGTETALDILLSGKTMPPAEALEKGIVDEVVPADKLMDAARAWLATGPDPVKPWDKKGYAPLASFGLLDAKTAVTFTMQGPALSAKTYQNYPAPIAIASLVFEGMQLTFDGAQALENKYFARLVTDPVSRNIIRTTFLNKGKNDALEMRPEGVPTYTTKKLGVLGAGMMGAGIAYVAAAAGIEVVLIDATQENADKGKAYSAKVLDKMVDRGKRTRDAADAVLARVTATTDYAQLEGADLVIEAVFEDTGVKADVTKKAAAVIPDSAPFASNTSTLPISTLAEAFVRPEDFIGLHFFSPVDRMALVEVIMGKKTSDATLAKALDFVKQIRKTPIVVNDSRGFYTSRVFQTFIHEGMAMLQEGVLPAMIENAGKMAGMPVGPLQVTDEVSIELPLKICNQAIKEEGDAYTVPVSYEVMDRMMNEFKRPGRKAGAGFYEYPEDGKKHLWKGLAEAFPVAETQPGIEELKKRLLYIQSLETVRCLEEGVLTRPEDGDIGAVLGWAFPTYTGGTMSLIDTVGVAAFVEECDALAAKYGPRFTPSPWLRERAADARKIFA
ncbi:MAG: 3-hydroxyacyl-CoA dehydrogenase [Confluentimicrobium sp.]|uniref:3-hydroxyacyl-CoA dehydrogenase NAD-binding domain-containing protein n=1 Tax=Actibacterium sp. TaxID=1872125 RepID=UPI000C63FACD|nr:3-hydroxyacyl-CoA dehydrogenase NAD-binding domain-containing protein [Actibacterium sp.]MBC57130.1 3-hydroxyacyl-CoA dehydrogenase [Actibacterium sp.]|tara:strand:+ start:9125 stop:11266 length:2142 start_codon:yes stop_codon:yes gene_type:complete